MISRTSWNDQDALLLANRSAEMVVSIAYGPRVMAFHRTNGPELFFHAPTVAASDAPPHPPVPDYRIRGGHRLWHAPEHPVRTYQPDNDPVDWKELPRGRGVALLAGPEADTGIQKGWTIEVRPRSFRITHTLKNVGLWPVELSPWALTMLAGGGQGIVPLPPRRTHAESLLPSVSFIPWDYTDFSLPVWRFHRDFIRIDTSAVNVPQKLGLSTYGGWSAYWRDGDLFVKTAAIDPSATYPDRGCCFETFTNGALIELETLGPLVSLPPGGLTSHTEEWGLIPSMPAPDDASYARAIRPAVEKWLKSL